MWWRRVGRGGVIIRERVGYYSIDLGGDLNDKKYIYKHIGLRRPLIDYFRHNNQPKTGGHCGGE